MKKKTKQLRIKLQASTYNAQHSSPTKITILPHFLHHFYSPLSTVRESFLVDYHWGKVLATLDNFHQADVVQACSFAVPDSLPKNNTSDNTIDPYQFSELTNKENKLCLTLLSKNSTVVSVYHSCPSKGRGISYE